jgi:hypothetical protein
VKAKTRRMLDRRNRLFRQMGPHTARHDSDLRTYSCALNYRFGHGAYRNPDSVATINACADIVDEILAEVLEEERLARAMTAPLG